MITFPRPKSSRIIKCDPTHFYFKPRGIPMKDLSGQVDITLEELETMRLTDLEGKKQVEVAEEMNISQSSVSRHLDEAHHKIAKALVLGFAIRISNPTNFFHCNSCGHTWRFSENQNDVKKCENCESTDFHAHTHTDSDQQIVNVNK
ncbi:MAG: DUF134 domain-containing protein [Candidatus Hodarchaeales archaeon]